MSERHKVKLTVLKRFSPSEVFETLPVKPIKPLEACGIYKDGQEFVIGTDMKMPEGFCTWAWNSIYLQAVHLMLDGDLPWLKEKGECVTCCTDGLRPVLFHLQRI